MIDTEVMQRIRSADMIAFLEKRHGFTFARKNGAYRCKEHPSLAVKEDRRSWYWHSKGIGGFGVLDYLVKIEALRFRAAIKAAESIAPAIAPPPSSQKMFVEKPFSLPQKMGIPLRLYDYLCVKRGIDGSIVNTLLQKEMLYEDRRGNVVFVGYDEQGAARFASLRGTCGDFRGDCAGSDKRFGFHMTAIAPSDRLYIFESPIDCMSHASLANAAASDVEAWKQHNRLSLAGTGDTAMPFFLKQHSAVRQLIFCLDNDPAGYKAAVSLSRKYADKGYTTRIELPRHKDFNEDLKMRIKQTRTTKAIYVGKKR